ncbi:1-phosphofructokinase [Bacillus sp. JCM 19047]|uniref:Tagatose-6-phosphate kinase n=1 Tax=Shouchella miscanthi TaxID=2598861 RepID=A0ABU6NQ01_9BACI|nr:1-phosphofructokinase [Shouchella miscanthi]MED4130258.1 1-phosphofructokinase [Shouchella miscanthi]GAF22485.1 1-phosphofructokinase [Bacillus sp. JCM 19047]
MIYTVTLNPAMDYYVSLPTLHVGHVNRSTSDRKVAGGKGINVSRVLKGYGTHSAALGFIGGFTGDFIHETVMQDGIDSNFIRIQGDTRINVKIKAEEESEINGFSPEITISDKDALEQQFKQLKKGDIVVLAGSIPPSLQANLYAEWTEQLNGQGVHVFVDTSGEALKQVIKAKPAFIKPNQHELAELTQSVITTKEDAIPHAKALVEQGVNYVLVSFAGDGALLATRDGIYSANAPKGELINSVGAGDATVAGFIHAHHEGASVEDAFRFGMASGSATAFSLGFGELAEVKRLEKEIEVSTT